MSKNVVFYYSGTGNSLAIAKSVAGELDDSLVVSMLNSEPLSFIDQATERIGLVFPVYMNAVPKVVVEFIEKLTPMPHVYFFAIATHGGVPGMAGLYLNKVLKKQKINLDGYFEIKMINNTPKGVAPKFLMSLDWELKITPEIIEVALKEAQVALIDSIRIIVDKDKTTLQNVPKGFKKLSYGMMKLLWVISDGSKHKLDFLLDEDACIGCGNCSKICLTHRIEMKHNKPEWVREHCNFCYACFNYCPTQAIGVKYYTKKLGRYHHPHITMEDIVRQKKETL